MSDIHFDIALSIHFTTVGGWLKFSLMHKGCRLVSYMVDKCPVLSQNEHQGSQQLSGLFQP